MSSRNYNKISKNRDRRESDRSRSYYDRSDSEEYHRSRRSRDRRSRSSSKETDNDTCVLLYNIPYNITKNDLTKNLTDYRVTYKNIKFENGDKFGCIEFFHHSDSTRFLKLCKGYLRIYDNVIEVRRMRSEDSKLFLTPPREIVQESEPCNTLIFKGLSEDTTEDQVRSAVCSLTNKIIYDVRLIRDKTSNTSRGFCFVELGTTEDAQALMNHIKNMKPCFAIHQRKINVGFAKNNFGFSCNNRTNDNSVASNAIAAARAVNSTLPYHLQDPKENIQTNPYQNVIPGDPKFYQFDPTSGYHVDPTTSLLYDMNIGTYYNPTTQDFLYFDYSTKCLIPFAKNNNTNTTSQTKPTPTSNASKKENPQHQALKESDKVAQDMEKWAKSVNTDSASKASEKKKQAQQIQENLRKAAALNEQIEAAQLYNKLSHTMKSDDTAEKEMLDQTLENDPHLSMQDLVCLLCKRKFPSKQVLIKHVTSSQLHLTNIEKAAKDLIKF